MSNKTNEKATREVNNVDAADTIVDAVFVIGTGSQNNNEELKYALRNLEGHCPFVRDVYICGECPKWVDTSVVKHLKWPDRFNHAKDANIIDKLRHACEQPGIAKNILFCSDDQFQTRECTWEDFAPRWLRKYTPTDGWYESRNRLWHTRLHKTLDRDRRRRREHGLDISAVYYYQPHIWMPMDRDKFIEYAKWSDYEHRDDTIIASGYFNYIDAGGDFNYDHIFISPNQKWPVAETHVAYSDTSFDAAMAYLKKKFPEPSRYEIGYTKQQKAVTEVQTQPEPSPREIAKEVPEVPDAKKEPPKAQISETDLRETILKRVQVEPAWLGLRYETLIAEGMRRRNVAGWEKVWGSIIQRWNETTDAGKLRVPVTVPADKEVKDLMSKFEKDYPADKDDKADKEEVQVKNDQPPEQPVKHECGVCKSKHKGLLPPVPQDATDLEYGVLKANGEFIKVTSDQIHPDSTATDTEETAQQPAVEQPVVEQPVVEQPALEPSVYTEGCLDCAVDHLSTAIAYLNSEAGRPTPMDVTLASGEVRVATNHLLLLGRMVEYEACISALDSYRTEESVFSAKTLSAILGQLINEGY